MKIKIKNSEELRLEIIRLKGELEIKEDSLKRSFEDVRDDFKPKNVALNLISNATGIDFNKENFVKTGILATISIILNRYFSKQESVIENKILSWAETLINKFKEFKSNSKE